MIHKDSDKRVPIEIDNVAITRDDSKCVLCGACKGVCQYIEGIYGSYTLEQTNNKAICIHCGQCTLVCPTGAIKEVEASEKVKEAIFDPDKIVIFQTAPSVRVALGDEFGLEAGYFAEGKMVSAIRKLGVDYVFDTTFGADITIMEEATELINRIQNNEIMPQFTSCCPAWVKYVEMFYPKLISNLSTARSPIMMLGSMIKTYFAKIKNIDPKQIVNVAVTPCTAKKYEITKDNDMEDFKNMDYVLTTRELAWLIKDMEIDFSNLEDSTYDSLLDNGSGAGYIFGVTGGVMEAACRTAYHLITNEEVPNNLLNFEEVRGLDGVKEAILNIANKTLKLAVISGTNNANKLIQKLINKEVNYDFIEVMACPGGCIAGGGQPIIDPSTSNIYKEKRSNSLYDKDNTNKVRNSYENNNIKILYKEFLEKPNSPLAKQLLHTTYESKEDLLHPKKIVN